MTLTAAQRRSLEAPQVAEGEGHVDAVDGTRPARSRVTRARGDERLSRGPRHGDAARRSRVRPGGGAGCVAARSSRALVAALRPPTRSPRAMPACRTTEVSVVAGAKVTLRLDCRGHDRSGSNGPQGDDDLGQADAGLARQAHREDRAGRLHGEDRRARRGPLHAAREGRPALSRGDRDPGQRAARGAARAGRDARPAPGDADRRPRRRRPPRTTGCPRGCRTCPPRSPRPPARGCRRARDTCPAALHDRFSVIGPDGKRYPTWHPPTYHRTRPPARRARSATSTATIRPRRTSRRGSREHLAASGYEAFAGLPFGLAAEALNAYADGHPGTAKRSEDHVGYKVDVADDVQLLGSDGGALGVTCDYLTVVHQGSHSPDALSNNAHELLYATRCDDGTQLISTTLSRFGDPGVYERSCEPETRIKTTDNGYPQGGGARLIPDRECVERNVLVPAGRTTSAWALYEKWTSGNTLTTPDGEHARVLRHRLRRLQPEPLRERRRHDRPHAPALLGDRRRRRPGRRRRLLAGHAARPHRVRRPAARRSTAPAATSTSPARPSATPAAAGSTGPTPTAATRRRRRSPARSASSSPPPTNAAERDRSRSSAATAATTRSASTRRTDALHTSCIPGPGPGMQAVCNVASAGAAAALGGDGLGELGVDLGGHAKQTPLRR